MSIDRLPIEVNRFYLIYFNRSLIALQFSLPLLVRLFDLRMEVIGV